MPITKGVAAVAPGVVESGKVPMNASAQPKGITSNFIYGLFQADNNNTGVIIVTDSASNNTDGIELAPGQEIQVFHCVGSVYGVSPGGISNDVIRYIITKNP